MDGQAFAQSRRVSTVRRGASSGTAGACGDRWTGKDGERVADADRPRACRLQWFQSSVGRPVRRTGICPSRGHQHCCTHVPAPQAEGPLGVTARSPPALPAAGRCWPSRAHRRLLSSRSVPHPLPDCHARLQSAAVRVPPVNRPCASLALAVAGGQRRISVAR